MRFVFPNIHSIWHYREDFASIALTRFPIWSRAIIGWVQTLIDSGETTQARDLALDALEQCQKHELHVATARELTCALALAEARLGQHAEAARRVEELIEEAKAGRVEFRVDKTANLHVPIGKTSFDGDKLLDNMTAFFEVIRKARPAAAKGAFIRRVTVADTMGPGIRVDPVEAQALESA